MESGVAELIAALTVSVLYLHVYLELKRALEKGAKKLKQCLFFPQLNGTQNTVHTVLKGVRVRHIITK